jgi:hypothetical protein
MFQQTLRPPSRSPSPSFNETVDPEIFEHHPAYRSLSHFGASPTMGEYTPISPQGVSAVLKNPETGRTLEFLHKLRSLGVEKYVDFPQVNF